MKKFILMIVFGSMIHNASAQATTIYQKIRQVISVTEPELSLENKLIAFNLWSADNVESRIANKNFDRAANVYQNARLKGGLKGLIVVAINKDNLNSAATIAMTKDGITKMISVPLENIPDFDPGGKNNMVFDSQGQEVYSNLAASQVFESINKLVTR